MPAHRHDKRNPFHVDRTPCNGAGSRAKGDSGHETSLRYKSINCFSYRTSFDIADSTLRTFISTPFVTLLVGESETPFCVHVGLLCNTSPFFKSAFKGPATFAETFEETIDKAMALPGENVDTIHRIVQWLYLNQISFDREALDKTPDEAQVPYMQLSSLYVAADKYGIIQLKNEIIDIVFKLVEGDDYFGPEDEVVKYIYSNTIEGSGLRALILEMHVWRMHPEWLVRHSKALLHSLPEFVIDLVPRMAFRAQYPQKNPFHISSQHFHDKGGSSASEAPGDSGSKRSSGSRNRSNDGGNNGSAKSSPTTV